MDISDSRAKQSATFDRPITGRELIDAVRATCESGDGCSFYESKRYDDRWYHAVGQRSHNRAQNLLVTPDRENAYIEPEKTYTRAVVLRWKELDQGTRTTGIVRVEEEAAAAVAFAESLQHTVKHGPDAGADRSRGPQSARAEYSGTDPVQDSRSAWGQRSGAATPRNSTRDWGR